MSYAVGDHFDKFIREQIESGRYNSAEEVVCEGLRLVEEREARFRALKDHIDRAIEEGGSFSDEEVGQYLEEERRKRRLTS